MIDLEDYTEVDAEVAQRLVKRHEEKITVHVDLDCATAVPLDDDWLVSHPRTDDAARMSREAFFEEFLSAHERGDGDFRNYIWREGPHLKDADREAINDRVIQAGHELQNHTRHYPTFDW